MTSPPGPLSDFGEGESARIGNGKQIDGRGRAEDIDEYIAAFPEEVRERLQVIRSKVRELAPDATEEISYGIPTFRLNGTYLVYFAGWKTYVSMYPVPEGDAEFEAEIAPYKAGKGTVRYAHKQPLPMPTIEHFVRQAVARNAARAK